MAGIRFPAAASLMADFQLPKSFPECRTPRPTTMRHSQEAGWQAPRGPSQSRRSQSVSPLPAFRSSAAHGRSPRNHEHSRPPSCIPPESRAQDQDRRVKQESATTGAYYVWNAPLASPNDPSVGRIVARDTMPAKRLTLRRFSDSSMPNPISDGED